MATQGYKDKRIRATQALRDAATKRKADAEQAIENAEAEIINLDSLLAWLDNMPVDEVAPKKKAAKKSAAPSEPTDA